MKGSLIVAVAILSHVAVGQPLHIFPSAQHNMKISRNDRHKISCIRKITPFLSSFVSPEIIVEDLLAGNLRCRKCSILKCHNGGRCQAFKNRRTGSISEFCGCKKGYLGNNCSKYHNRKQKLDFDDYGDKANEGAFVTDMIV